MKTEHALIDTDALEVAVNDVRFHHTIHFEDGDGIYMLSNPFQNFWKVSFTPDGEPPRPSTERKGLSVILDYIATTYPRFYEYLGATYPVERKESEEHAD